MVKKKDNLKSGLQSLVLYLVDHKTYTKICQQIDLKISQTFTKTNINTKEKKHK